MDSKQYILDSINRNQHTQFTADQLDIVLVPHPQQADKRRLRVRPAAGSEAFTGEFNYDYYPVNLSAFSSSLGLFSVEQLRTLSNNEILASLTALNLFGDVPFFDGEVDVLRPGVGSNQTSGLIEIRPKPGSWFYTGYLWIALCAVNSYTVTHLGGLPNRISTRTARAQFDDQQVMWSLTEMRTIDAQGRVERIAGRQRMLVDSLTAQPVMDSTVQWDAKGENDSETIKSSLKSTAFGPRAYIDGTFYCNSNGPVTVRVYNAPLAEEGVVIWQQTLAPDSTIDVRIPLLVEQQYMEVVIAGPQAGGALKLDADVLDLLEYQQPVEEYRPEDLSVEAPGEPFNRFRFSGNQRLDTARDFQLQIDRTLGIWVDTDRLPATGGCALLQMVYDENNHLSLTYDAATKNMVAQLVLGGVLSRELKVRVVEMRGPRLVATSVTRGWLQLWVDGDYVQATTAQDPVPMSAYLRVGGQNSEPFVTNGFFCLPWGMTQQNLNYVGQTIINR